MTESIHIEPGHVQRPAFALWGLAQDPPLQTASASGWDVPLDLYPSIPVELLEGAYADGYAIGNPIDPASATEPVEAPAAPAVEVPTGGPRTQEARRSRKAAAAKPRTNPATIVKAPESKDSATDGLVAMGILGGGE